MIDAGIFYVIPPPSPPFHPDTPSRFMHRGTSPRPAYTHLSIYVNVTVGSKLVVNRTRRSAFVTFGKQVYLLHLHLLRKEKYFDKAS